MLTPFITAIHTSYLDMVVNARVSNVHFDIFGVRISILVPKSPSTPLSKSAEYTEKAKRTEIQWHVIR